MSKHTDGRSDLRAFDLTAFIRAKREMRGTVRLSELGRMVTEVPADAPAGALDELLEWRAEGDIRREVRRQADGAVDRPGARASEKALTAASHTVSQPYLTLQVRGRSWLECQRCMRAFEFPVDISTVYRVMDSEKAADAIALDEAEVIVGSESFDFYDLIDEEVVLTLPMVPKHDVCPAVHTAVVSGVDGSLGVESAADIEARIAAADAIDAENVVLPGELPLGAEASESDDSDGSEALDHRDAPETHRANGKPAAAALTPDGRPKPFASLEGLRKRLASDSDSGDDKNNQ